ncbi:MAG: hypothetical protein U0228_02770 [Myxococcaceae bacterium]
MTAAFLALCLGAWPLPADAGRAEWAEPANWPAEPGWASAWPLLSFTPPGWSLSAGEADAGVGMSIDRAFSVTRGVPAVTIALINAPVDLTDPLVAGAWRLNAGECPDAGDTNGNGRLDVGDFASDGRVSDLNGNGALDLDDVVRALSDGVDQDQNGRVDDLCGWDFDRDAGVRSTLDAGTARWLAAPLDDGLDPVGACPGCTLEPWVDARLAGATSASAARVVVVAPFDGELSPALLSSLARERLVLTPASPSRASPLEVHPAVLAVRALSAAPDQSTAVLADGCGGPTRGGLQASARSCGLEATVLAAGVAGLAWSARPSLSPVEVEGLLGGGRIDAFGAVTNPAVALAHDAGRGLAALATPSSDAEQCWLRRPGGSAIEISCDGGVATDDVAADLDARPELGFVDLLERRGTSTWVTPLPAPPASARRGLVSVRWDAFGSLAPRFVDPEQLEFDVHAFSPAASRLPMAVGLLDADRRLDRVALDDDGHLLAVDIDGRPTGLSETLASAPADGPALVPSARGPVVVTTERSGRVVVRVGADSFTLEATRPLVRGAAVGPIDLDDEVDVAVADGEELHAWLLDSRGATSASWTQPSRATEVLLADLVGDGALELVAEQVFDSRGRPLLTLDGWVPSPWPAMLTRLEEGRARSLVQLEPRADGSIDLARYDVERALRAGDSLVERQRIATLRHVPAPGGMAATDFDGDARPDVLVPTVDGLLFAFNGEGVTVGDTPLSTWGTVLGAPTLGVKASQLQVAVRTTRGEVVTFLARGLVADLTWDGPGHDESNARNAQTAFHTRQLPGLGVPDPPIPPQGCHCGADASSVLLVALAVLRRRRPWAASPSDRPPQVPSSPS